MWSPLTVVLAVPYDPGTGTPPPRGAELGFQTVMNWVAWGALAVVVICAIGAGVQIAASYFGHGQPKLAGLLYVGVGALVVSTAGALVGGISG